MTLTDGIKLGIGIALGGLVVQLIQVGFNYVVLTLMYGRF